MFRNGLEPWHVIPVVIIIVLVFGANRLPGIAKSLAQSLKIFRNEMKDPSGDSKPDDATKDKPTDSDAGTKA